MIEHDGEVLRVQGPVTLDTVPGLLESIGAAVPAGVRRIDLSGATEVDSSAVAFALELQRRSGGAMSVQNAPVPMRNLARLYGVSSLLGLDTE